MATLPPYATISDAMAAAPDLVAYLRTGTGTVAHAVHAAVTILSYGLSLGLPDPAVMAAAKPMKNAELALALEHLGKPGVTALPWAAMIAALIQLLLSLLHPTP